MSESEIARRKQAALAAIKNAFSTEDAEFSVTLFVTHHLDQLDQDYWQKHLGVSRPEPVDVLELLVLRGHWSDEDDDGGEDGDSGIDYFDFTLPGDVTDYMLSVAFDEDGEIEDISMES